MTQGKKILSGIAISFIVVIIGFLIYPNIGLQKDSVLLSPPQNLSAIEGNESLTLSWDAPEKGEVDGYVVMYSDDGENITEEDTKSNDTSYILSNLKNGTSYYVAMRAYNSNSVSDMSDYVQATPSKGGDVAYDSVASEPLNVSVSISKDGESVDISWDEPLYISERAIPTEYIVYFYDPINKGQKASFNTGGMGNFISIPSSKDLDFKINYPISVALDTDSGTGLESSPVNLLSENTSVSSMKPLNLIAVFDLGLQQISLTWDHPTGFDPLDRNPDFEEYVVYYKKEGGRDFIQENTGSLDNSFSLKNIEQGYTYEIKIVVNYGLAQEESNIVSVSTDVMQGDNFEFSQYPTVYTNSDSASVTWGTSKSASSIVYYGATDSFGRVREMNKSDLVKGHTVLLQNLLSCTVYQYKVASYDAEDNHIESNGGEFMTKGCISDVIKFERDISSTSKSAVVEVKTNNRGIRVVAPGDIVSNKEVLIQAVRVEREGAISAISKPEGRTWIGGSYVLSAVETGELQKVSSFEKPVSVSIDYLNSDLNGANPETLKIWHYEEENGWMQLNSCSYLKNEDGGTVTCLTNSFSVFGLFGEGGEDNSQEEENGGGGGQGEGGEQSGGDQNESVSSGGGDTAVNRPTSSTSGGTAAPISNNQVSEGKTMFTKNMWLGLKNLEVKLLQMFLNSRGFRVSESGPGSPGNETDFFGPKTKEALINFQNQNKEFILTPIGLNFGTGFFGPMTRNFINSL